MEIYRNVRTNKLTQGFGLANTWPSLLPKYQSLGLKWHNGKDWATKPGEKSYWPVNIRGKVISISLDATAGLGIEVITEDKDGIFKHIFWHYESIAVKVGQILETGDFLGICDSTGFSTGNHDHRGLKKQGKDKFGRYHTLDKDNGGLGAIDDSQWFRNIFVLDYLETQKKEIKILIKENLNLIQKIVSWINDFLKGR